MWRSGSWFSVWLGSVCVAVPMRAGAAEPLTITVEGDARPRSEIPSEPFVASSRLGRRELSAPALHASEALRGEVGVQIAESGGLGAPATASIRGASAAQTPVYLGGVRLNDQVGGVADLSTIPLWLVERVDVYRGNGPLDAGELGIGGAIFFEPKRPGANEAAASVTVGSFGTKQGSVYGAATSGRAALLLGLSAEHADNDYTFKDDRGTLFQSADDRLKLRQNADAGLRDGWLLARTWPSERASVELLLNHADRQQGVPKLALVPSRAARADLSRTLAGLTARLRLGSAGQHLLTLRSSAVEADSQVRDPERELGTLTERTQIVGRRLEERALLELSPLARLGVALGASGNVETLRRRDDELTSVGKTAALRGVGRLAYELWPAFTLSGLISVQCRTSQPANSGCDPIEPSGRLSLGFRGRGFTWFANLSRYQREPTLGELYGAGVLVRGNRTLRSELGVSADVGVRASVRRGPLLLTAEASAFGRTARELVAYARAAQGYVVPVNVGRARVLGLELSGAARLFERAELSLAASLLDPRDVTPGRRLENDVLPFMSRLVLTPKLRLSTGELEGRALKQADLSVDLSYLSNRFADAAGLIVIPEQATLGVSAAATWLAGVLVTRLRVADALDAARFDIVGYPLPGRSLYAALEVRTP